MTVKRIRIGRSEALLTVQPHFKPGDPPPPDHDYLGWHEWAEVQGRAGLKQKQCGKCSRWKFPQELSGQTIKSTVYRDKRMTKPVLRHLPVCLRCAKKMRIG